MGWPIIQLHPVVSAFDQDTAGSGIHPLHWADLPVYPGGPTGVPEICKYQQRLLGGNLRLQFQSMPTVADDPGLPLAVLAERCQLKVTIGEIGRIGKG